MRPPRPGGVHWQFDKPSEVMADPALLRQVFVNLFSNALKYSAPRDRTQIEVGTDVGNDGTVVVFVRDNGVGFDMAYKDRLFGVVCENACAAIRIR